MSWCIDCGEDFRYDDTGGYNPPCICGAHCRSCHEAERREESCDLYGRAREFERAARDVRLTLSGRETSVEDR